MFHLFPERIKLGKEGHKSHMSERDAVLKTNQVLKDSLPSHLIFNIRKTKPVGDLHGFQTGQEGLDFSLSSLKERNPLILRSHLIFNIR